MISYLKKPAVIAATGVVAGIATASVLVFFVFGGSDEVSADTPTPEPTPVRVAGKLGPHVTLEDRVFNLLTPGTPVYLKLQTVIEFETTDAEWADVLHGCVAAEEPHDLLVSAAPRVAASPRLAAAEGGGAGGCEAEYAALLADFETEIGTGRQLIEDAVTSIVTGKTPEDVQTPEGKDALKREIEQRIEQLLPGREVTNVLFVEFITQ